MPIRFLATLVLSIILYLADQADGEEGEQCRSKLLSQFNSACIQDAVVVLPSPPSLLSLKITH